MNLDFTPAEDAFRLQVRTFIEENYPQEVRDAQNNGRELTKQQQLSWQKVLAEKGWAAPGWPVEWGGQDWTPAQHFIFREELARAETFGIVPFGPSMLAPVLWTYGTEEQKREFLPKIYNGDIWFCQGYSEPGAGSDLASLRTRAERITDPEDGREYYIVNGQKTWTTLAQYADWGFFLVRTDLDAKPQAGISFLLIDMKSPGITVKRITTIEGGHEVNDVFLENVKVPVKNRVHEENKGWSCAKALLVHERIGLAQVAAARVKLGKLKDMAKTEFGDDGRPLIETPAIRRKLTMIEVEIEALAMTELKVLSDAMAGKELGHESSIFKIRGTEIIQRLTELSVEIIGDDARPYITEQSHNSGILNPHAMHQTWDYLNNRKLSIFGGSNEIQRNIIAKAVLGI